MEQKVLDEILRKHDFWLNDNEEGERANLYGANLRSADLHGANLYGANLHGANLRSADLRSADLRSATGNNKHIKSIQTSGYEVVYSDKVLYIGCERHDIKDWWEFDDDTINEMGEGAIEWWKIWKPILQNIIEVSPAEPTKSE